MQQQKAICSKKDTNKCEQLTGKRENNCTATKLPNVVCIDFLSTATCTYISVYPYRNIHIYRYLLCSSDKHRASHTHISLSCECVCVHKDAILSKKYSWKCKESPDLASKLNIKFGSLVGIMLPHLLAFQIKDQLKQIWCSQDNNIIFNRRTDYLMNYKNLHTSMLDLPLFKCNLNILNNSSLNILNNNLNKQIGLSIYEIKINKSTELPLNFFS